MTPDGPFDDWSIAVERGANILLQGDLSLASRALRDSRLRSPLQILSPGAQFTLPPGGTRTLVLEHVEGLDVEEQMRLLRWMEDPGRRTQIRVNLVSTAARARPVRRVSRGSLLPSEYRAD